MTDGDAFLTAFGSRLRQERIQAGLSQESLAQRAALDRTYLSGVERGVRNLSLKKIAVLATALNIEPASLLADAVPPTLPPSSHTYVYDPNAVIECGFRITSTDIVSALASANGVFRALPMTLFATIDLKSQSGIVGAVFAEELASRVGAIPNPIEKGHPDIVPASAAGASEASLRNYPRGLEIKSTIGGVAKGSALVAGQERIDALVSVVWQAHHREVRALMGLVWDFVGGAASRPAHPTITGAFYTKTLVESDWGAIAGTTGRNTKVTGMKMSGRRKMARGALAMLRRSEYEQRYASCLGVQRFADLVPFPD